MTSRRNLQEVPIGDDSRPTPTRTVTSLAVSAVCGLMFGFAIEKGKGSKEHIIIISSNEIAQRDCTVPKHDDLIVLYNESKQIEKIPYYTMQGLLYYSLSVPVIELLSSYSYNNYNDDHEKLYMKSVFISVYEPAVVKNQMLLSQFVMMKMFLSGIISGMFVLAMMSMLPSTRRRYLGAKSVFVRGLREKGFLTTLSGGALLGSGMAIAGSCPGVILAQLGSGTQNSMYTLLGALFGTLLYGILEPVVTDLTKPAQTIRFQFLYNVYGSPFFVMALPFAAVLSLVVFTLELAYPWEEEINITDSVYQSSSWITSPAWPPFMSGIAVGSLQIPVVLVIGDTLGASSSFCTITSQFFLHKSSKRLSPYLLKFQSGIENWWQVAFVLSSIFGAFLSSILSGTYGSVAGVSIVQSFVGGALILFGARMAGGCTSGHGLSGIGLLNLLSISTIAAMFVGGVLTATVLQWIS